jgi:hypothetical protein
MRWRVSHVKGINMWPYETNDPATRVGYIIGDVFLIRPGRFHDLGLVLELKSARGLSSGGASFYRSTSICW